MLKYSILFDFLAISRERDELLALVDVAERLKYEQGKSKVAEDEYGSFSSSEVNKRKREYV